MLKRLAAAAVLALASAACSDPALPTEQWVRARADGNATLAITNRGGEPVHFKVVDPTHFAIFTACTPTDCPRVRPGETVRVPYSTILYYEPGSTQAMVEWASFTSGEDGSHRQSAYGSVIVGL